VKVLHPPAARRLKILHVIGNFHIGGSARLVVDLVEHLGHLYDQQVIARELPDVPAYSGIPLRRVKRFKSPGAALDLIRSCNPDFVHVHYLGHWNHAYSLFDWGWYRNVFEALEQFDCKVIENVNIPVEPFYSSSVDCYVHVSDYVRHKFGFNDCHNVTIHPGSDLTVFSRAREDQHPDDHIGLVYRLDPDKLNARSIDVFIEVVRRRPQTRVIIVGGGQLLAQYQDAARKAQVENSFEFPGYVAYEALPQWLARMSVFVAPVHTESFGQVSPFAMGMKLPVAGYNVGALREILGSADTLAPYGDVNKLAAIIISLLDDRERRIAIGETNRRRAEKYFSLESMIRGYRDLYSSMVAPGQESPAHLLDAPLPC
jgi:glycosyltransferase involved in cell wall biosynthesis